MAHAVLVAAAFLAVISGVGVARAGSHASSVFVLGDGRYVFGNDDVGGMNLILLGGGIGYELAPTLQVHGLLLGVLTHGDMAADASTPASMKASSASASDSSSH